MKCSVHVFDWGDAYGVGPAVFDVGQKLFLDLLSVFAGSGMTMSSIHVFPVSLPKHRLYVVF